MDLSILFILLLKLSLVTSKHIHLNVKKRSTEPLYPWLIQFRTINPCGAILIHPNWILTAAQCIHDKRHAIVFQSVDGDLRKSVRVDVEAIYIHPQYDIYTESADYTHNMALLKLWYPFYPNYIREENEKHIYLETGGKGLDNYESCMIFGWNSSINSDHKISPGTLETLDVNIIEENNCLNPTHIYATVKVDGLDEVDKLCAGNPGTPIVCKDKGDGQLTLNGIAVWSNFSLTCNGLSPYLNMNPFQSWIDHLISIDHPKWTHQGSLPKNKDGNAVSQRNSISKTTLLPNILLIVFVYGFCINFFI